MAPGGSIQCSGIPRGGAVALEATVPHPADDPLGIHVHEQPLHPAGAHQRSDHAQGLPAAHQQPAAAAAQVAIEGPQALEQERHPGHPGLRMVQQGRIQHEQRQHRAAPAGQGQGRVVVEPQVAAEPDEAEAHTAAGQRARATASATLRPSMAAERMPPA